MPADPALGVALHAVGGLAAASFYLPFKRVRGWAWESYWLVGGVASWIIAPWVVASITTEHLLAVFSSSPWSSLLWTFFFGALWGVGGLTFGLSMRYLGLSLGYSLALGFCAAFGTLVPPIFQGRIVELTTSISGLTTLAGVAICLVGIAVCAIAGMRKEKELPADQKSAAGVEFHFRKGLWIALFCGVMSACMSFAIATGEAISETAESLGTDPLWRVMPVLVVVLAGGFVTNLVWCLYLNARHGTFSDYLNFAGAPIALNCLFALLAGVTWYLQFMFYGMGTTQMGAFEFSSWTLHMAFIIVFGNLWGIYFREWDGAGRRTRRFASAGLAILVTSTIVVGLGNYLGS